MSRRKHRAYNRMRPHQPPKGTGGRGMRTAPGPSWAKRPSTPTTLEEPQPESAQECPESQPQPEPQEKPRASEAEGGDGSQNDRVTAMARADDAMPIGQATGEIRDSWNGSRETVNVQPDPNPNNEERKDVGKNEDQREKEPPAQLEGQSEIDDLLVGLLGGGSGTGDGVNAGSEVFDPGSSPFGALLGYEPENDRATYPVPGLSLPGRKHSDESPAYDTVSRPSHEPRIEIAPLPAVHLETRERARERRRAGKADESMAATPRAVLPPGVATPGGRPGAAPRVRRSRHRPPKPAYPRVSSKRKTHPLPNFMRNVPRLPGQQPRVAKQQRRRRG